MEFRVLVVDDQIVQRENDFKYFSTSFTKLTSCNLSLDFVYHPAEIEKNLSEKYYDAIISDVVLNNTIGWENFTLDSLFTIINNLGLQDIPLLLLSEVWNVTNSDVINRALSQQQWKGFIHYRDICDDKKGDVAYPASQLYTVLKKAKNIGGLNQRINENDDIRILHLSDLQHGGFLDDTLQTRTQLAIDEMLTYWKQQPPHFICISGDVSEHGLPEEYLKATEWLRKFENQLEKPNIYCVPGNHDICIPLAGASRVNLIKEDDGNKILMLNPPEEILNPTLEQYALTPFKNFLNPFSGIKYLDDTLPSAPGVDSRFRHIGILFFGFNTAIPSAIGMPGRKACPTALNLITNELSEIQKTHPRCCTIGIMHHSPVPVADGESIDNNTVFKVAFKGSVRAHIVCHGHQHAWNVEPKYLGKYHMLISQAQTFNKTKEARPEDSLRGFNLLTIGRKDNVVSSVKAATCNFDGEGFYCREHPEIEDFYSKNFSI